MAGTVLKAVCRRKAGQVTKIRASVKDKIVALYFGAGWDADTKVRSQELARSSHLSCCPDH